RGWICSHHLQSVCDLRSHPSNSIQERLILIFPWYGRHLARVRVLDKEVDAAQIREERCLPLVTWYLVHVRDPHALLLCALFWRNSETPKKSLAFYLAPAVRVQIGWRVDSDEDR